VCCRAQLLAGLAAVVWPFHILEANVWAFHIPEANVWPFHTFEAIGKARGPDAPEKATSEGRHHPASFLMRKHHMLVVQIARTHCQAVISPANNLLVLL
jgi:hypothetical protein